MRRVVLAAAVLLASAAVAAPDQVPLAKACPNLTLAQVEAIENYKGQFAENAWYARSNCVSVAEAERRMRIQERDAIGPKTEPGPPPAPPSDSIGSISAALQAREAATFAGVWIEHTPRYRVVFAFTRDAAATLARYTRDPLFEARNRPGPTLAQLDEAQARLMRVFQERGYRWASAGRMEQVGKVVFELAQDAAPIRAAAARGEFDLPPWVELKEPRPFPVPAPAKAAANDQRVHAFPQLRYRTDMYPSTEMGVPPTPATLELRAGCLVLKTDGGTRVALWGAEDALDLSDPRSVSVINRLSGTRIRVGEKVSITGLQPGIEESRNKAEKVGEASTCPGPYQVVNGYKLQSSQDAQDREERITTLMRRHKLSRVAAEARFDTERRRATTLAALRARLLSDHGDKLGGVWVNKEEATIHLFVLPGTRVDQLVPAALRGFLTSQQVPRSGRELESARIALEAQLVAAGIRARVDEDVIGGTLNISNASDLRALSAAAVAGKVRFPDFARIGFDNAMPLGGYSGIPWDELLQRYERVPEFNAIRELVAASDLPSSPEPGRNDRPLRKPGRAQSLDIAHWLIANGFTDAKAYASLQRAGVDPADAWVRQNGLSTPRTHAILAEHVVVAEPVAIDLRDPGRDGYRSTVTWRVVETLKGSLRAGETVKQRLVSGEEPDGKMGVAVDEPMLLPGLPNALDTGSRWLLHLSLGTYRTQSLLVGGEGAARAGVLAAWQAPARIVDGQVSLQTADQRPVTLEALRKAVAPVQQAFERAGVYAAASSPTAVR